MAKHIVKCKICGKQFDASTIQAVKCGGRRYAHFDCYPEGELVPLATPEDPDLIELKKYITNLFGDKANWAMINKQLKDYKQKNYTYSGILKSLIYFFEIKNNSIEKANGALGIVPFVYQDAYNYYYALYLAQEANKNKSLLTQIKEIIIKPPCKKGVKKKLFNLEDIEDEE